MKKKKRIIIILPIIILSLILILLLTKKQNSWIDGILKQDYEIYSLKCDGTTINLSKNELREIKKYWKDLSNNGPFLGDLNTCYKKIIINYNNDIAVIEILDNSSLIVKESSKVDYYTYYTKSNKLISHLNRYF